MQDAADAAIARALDGTRVLVCYGLLGEVMAGLRPLGMDYMATQMAWLRGLGVAAEVVRLPTVAPVGVNAARIAAAIEADATPVLLVGHSKGGLEALAALLLPGVAPRCRGFLALQCPFRGSPLADLVLGLRGARLAAHHAARLLRLGTGRGVKDLTTAVRGRWMEEKAGAVAALVAQVPVTTLATAIGPRPAPADRVHAPLARWMERMGAGPNDGLVPVASALIEGARCRVEEGGHRALVAPGAGRDPVGLLRREIGILLAARPAGG
ncbi:hypothetical protein [Falsiroseomonas sp. CW058]|uniref:hypothetical protein n=1 Tax=Falsiroseomonas sp. CW058 TaxID=3388664 RepID=UPI003D31900C